MVQELEIAKFKISGVSNFSYVDKSVKVPTLARTLYSFSAINHTGSGQQYEPNVKFAEGAFQLQFMNLSVEVCGQEVSNSFLERYQGKDFRRFFCPSDPTLTSPKTMTFCLDLIIVFAGSGVFGDGQDIRVPITVGLERLSQEYAWWIGSNQLVWSARESLLQLKSNQTAPVNDCWLICRDGSSSAPLIIFQLNRALSSRVYDKGQFQFKCLAPQLKYHAHWQSQLPEEKLITDISLPGTHDSAAITKDHTPFACQTLSISGQLMAGVRFLDIRIKILNKAGKVYFATCHGGDKFGPNYSLTRELNTFQSLESVFNECTWFLRKFPREFIVMMLQIEGWSAYKIGDKTALDELWALVKKYNVYPISDVPRVGDVRGRICILNHLDNSSPLIYSDDRFGRVLSWVDKTDRYSEVFSDTYDPNILNLIQNLSGMDGGYARDQIFANSIALLVQDHWGYDGTFTSKAVSDKLTKYNGILNDQQIYFATLKNDSFKINPAKKIVINFGSAVTIPGNQDVDIRPLLLEMLGNSDRTNRPNQFRWSCFNYTDQEFGTDKYGPISIIDLIVDANFSYSRFPDSFKLK